MEESVTRPRPGLKPPSKLPASLASSIHGGQGLHEITDSQNNSRAQITTTGHVGGQKRNVPAPGEELSFHRPDVTMTAAYRGDIASYPDSKRKLAGASMEFNGRASVIAGVPRGAGVRGNSLKDLTRPHLSSSTTSFGGPRQTSNSSYTSSSSYGSSIGPGGRPPSQSHTRARSVTRPVRPATSLGTTREEGQGSNGMVSQPTTSSSIPVSSRKPKRKPRKPKSVHGLTSSKSSYDSPIPREREASLTEGFEAMSLDGKGVEGLGVQASSQPNTEVTLFSDLALNVTPRSRAHDIPRVSQNSEAELQNNQVVPETPVTDKLFKKLKWTIRAATTPAAALASSASPRKTNFLTRYSNTRGYSVHDIDEKVNQMDTELQRVKEFMESAERNGASVKEELEASKRRALALEEERNALQSDRMRLKDQLEDAERVARRLQYEMEEERRKHEREYKILEDDHRRELQLKTDEFSREMSKFEKLQQEFESKCGAEAEARLERLSQENKELRSALERQKREHEHEIRLLHEDIHRRDAGLKRIEGELQKAANEQLNLETQIHGNNETIDRLRKRAEDAEERLSKDQGHLGGQISLLSSTLDLKSERIQTLEENAKKLQAECEMEVQRIKAAADKLIADETSVLREKLIKEEERRHKLFEQLQELKGNIRVMCRIKPPSDPAKDALIPFKPQMNEIEDDKIDGLIIPTVREDPTEPGRMLPGKPRDFSFERVFDEKCTNRDVFDEISQLVQSVMDGKKVCIFCYGQTGSGKTFTMSKRAGDNDDGVIPRTQAMIFSEVERLKALGWEYTIEGSYLEVYQDRLYNLLASRNSKPEPLTVDPLGEDLKIKGHDFTLLHDARDLDEMVRTADNNRHVAATAKNDRSSRSHSILVLKVTGVKRNEDGEVIKTRKGTLNLIDLAGSEKPDKSGPPQVYKEGVEINSSLSYLRTVLASLGQGKTEGVDFRSYTLTQLLRPSLGKGCRTLMFVMVSPLKENENETIRSLEFARDAQKVKMGGNGAAKSKR